MVVDKEVWKDTADCREDGCSIWYKGVWGNQVLWSMKLCPPSWWSKTSITTTDDCGCWPEKCTTQKQHYQLYQGMALPAKKYHYWHQGTFTRKQKPHNASSVIHIILCLLSLSLYSHNSSLMTLLWFDILKRFCHLGIVQSLILREYVPSVS